MSACASSWACTHRSCRSSIIIFFNLEGFFFRFFLTPSSASEVLRVTIFFFCPFGRVLADSEEAASAFFFLELFFLDAFEKLANASKEVARCGFCFSLFLALAALSVCWMAIGGPSGVHSRFSLVGLVVVLVVAFWVLALAFPQPADLGSADEGSAALEASCRCCCGRLFRMVTLELRGGLRGLEEPLADTLAETLAETLADTLADTLAAAADGGC